MEHGTISLAPSTKRSKRLAAKKVNNKRGFSSVVESYKSNPLIQATRVTDLLKCYFINAVNKKLISKFFYYAILLY